MGLQIDTTESTIGDGTECYLITGIRATDVSIKLRRIPVGFYIAVEHGNVIQRTSNKAASVGKDVIEWDDEIVLPLDASSMISLTVFASFELGPTLGDGEVVHRFESTVDDLLDRNGRFQPIKFSEHRDENIISSGSSFEIKIEQRVCDRNEYVVASNPPESEEMCRLGGLTSMGHNALIRYREHEQERDLDESIKHFEHAESLCPLDHPSRATVLFNLATARLIYCRVNVMSPDLDMSINLYWAALRLRPRGHPDHGFTLLSLGIALQVRFQRQHDEADEAEGQRLLSQVLDVSPTDSYAYHTAVLARGSAAKSDDGEVQRLDAALQRIFYPGSSRHPLLDHLGILSCIQLHSLSDHVAPENAISVLDVVVRSTPDNHPDKATWLDGFGKLLATRHESCGDLADLEKSISMREEAVRLTADGDPKKPTRLNNLGYSLLARYECLGNVLDLERSISMNEEALRLTPNGHSAKPLRLGNLGNALSTRYEHFGDVADLEKSISMTEEGLHLTRDSHPHKPSLLENLGYSLLTRYERFGDIVDLEKSISTRENALRLTANRHGDKPLYLHNLAQSLVIRYERFGDIVDLEKSTSMVEEALQLTPDGHPDKPSQLNNLAYSLLARYERFGDVVDLEKSISIAEKVLQLTHDDHPKKPLRLNNLANSLSARYDRFGDNPSRLANLADSLPAGYTRFGDVLDLDKSISLREEALRLTPDGHLNKPLWLNNLSKLLLFRYEDFGNVADLEKSKSTIEEGLQLTPDGHPDKPVWLSTLRYSLLSRYERFGNVVDLEQSILMAEDGVRLVPDGHPHKPSWLSNLGYSLLARYERFGDIVDLEKSISMTEEALHLIPDGHPDKASRMHDLSRLFLTRYKRFGDNVDLEKSILVIEQVVQLTPGGDPDKLLISVNLGHSLSARYARFGDVVDLEKLISMTEEALQLISDGHPDKPSWLNNFGKSLLTRYERFGVVVDLEKSVSMIEEALRLIPDGHPGRPSCLNNLGKSLFTRYEHFGNVLDLEKAISVTEEGLQLTPNDHPDKALRLHSLGCLLSSRYECFRDVGDLEKSILMKEEAVQLTPDGHQYKRSRHGNLAYSLWTRYLRFKDIYDLEKAISIIEEGLQLIPDGHPDKPLWLNNLGNCLLTRYLHSEDLVDLEKSMSMTEEALQLTPDGHPDKPAWLNNLAKLFFTRYERFGDVIHLEKSISVLEDVVQFTPDGDPCKCSRLDFLSFLLLKRFQRSGSLSSSDLSSNSDLPRASLYSCQAAHSRTAPSSDRFRASQRWIQCVRLRHDPQSLLDAYTVTIDLLPQLAWIGLSLHDRHHQLLQATDVACDAAAVALDAHLPELAVEWLEQGRSIVWSQLSQLRTPVDDLRTAYPELAAQFERVSYKLERASTWGKAGVGEFMTDAYMMDGLLANPAGQHHALALERERLLGEIRSLPGFERFLLPNTINQLSSLAHSGPVVFLNASRHRCDALAIVTGTEHVVHVPLLNTSYSSVTFMQQRMNTLLSLHNRAVIPDDSNRGARLSGMTSEAVFGHVLPTLWDKVVSPILEALGFSTSGRELSRIFWCPTGPFAFLPIHAAGHYGTPNSGHKVSDFVISSYIPTMTALQLRQEDLKATSSSHNIRLLAIPQPSTDGQVRLTCVREEMEIIRKWTSSSPFVELLETHGTVEDVLAKMAKSDWVHFGCHATQDRTNPLNSGLLLAQCRRLKLSDIVRLSRPRGGLAFLSACQTAKGDEQLSEEAIHLAAGMLLAGYKGVIATMWSIMDNDAPKVTEDIYKSLLQDGKVPESGQAAEALHHAIEQLRESGAPFLSWVPFIHVGL